MREIISKAIPLFCLLLGGAGCGSSLRDDLVGRWESATCEVYPGSGGSSVYVKRETTFTTTDITVLTNIYSDASCTTPFSASRFTAEFTLGGPTEQDPEATEVDYAIKSRSLTPLSSDAVDTLNSGTGGKCGSGTWVLDQSADTGQTGCPVAGIPSIAQCPTELDFIKITDDKLFSGDRTVGVDACKVRLSKLGPLFITKKAD